MFSVNNLHQVRVQKGYTQQALAGRVGISRQAYAAIEAGRSIPSTDVAMKLALALDTTVEGIFSLKDDSEVTVAAQPAADLTTAENNTPVRLTQVGPRLLARPSFGASAAAHQFIPAEGLIRSTRESDGQLLVQLLDEEATKIPTLVMSGCDPAAAFLASALGKKGVRLVSLERGSQDALRELAWGEAHIAGCHIFDEASGCFNLPWIAKLVPFPCTVLHFAVWREGLMTAPGNPKGIGGIDDFARPDVSMVNRQKGSGSRMLLDRLLGQHGILSSQAHGYGREVNGHLTAAEVIAAGFADVGVGIEAAAKAFELGFVPLGEEQYDLVIPNHFIEQLSTSLLLDTLRKGSIRRSLSALGSYDTTSMGLPVTSG
jgi:putative molybdopterin biosynthesis protein